MGGGGVLTASAVNDFEQSSASESGAWNLVHLSVPPHPPPPLPPAGARELAAVSSLSWQLLAFRRDAHLSSSLINNYCVCGPPDRPCILMTGLRRGGGDWTGLK